MRPKKIYPIDTGLITAYSIKPGYDEPSLLETEVFLQLRRQNQKIYYYKTQRGKEIDFLTIYPNGKMALYQVCLSMKDKTTRQRELTAIIQGMGELKLQHSTIVTMDESEELQTESGCIHIVPLWEFLTSGANALFE